MARQVDAYEVPGTCPMFVVTVEPIGVAILAGSPHDLHTQPLQLLVRRSLLSLQQK